MKRISNYSKTFKFITSRKYSSNDSYDICIVGGGPVGFGFASLLSSCHNLKSSRILLLESEKYRPFVANKQFSNRTVALSPKTREILEKCGAWEMLKNHRFNPVKKMFIWEQSSDSFITFQNDDTHLDLAYIVENDLLQHAIITSLRGLSNVEVRYETKVSDIDFQSPDVTVTLSDGSRVYSSLLVGADGFRSRVREQAGIKSVVRQYDQKAVVCVVKFQSEDTHQDAKIAWQRFTRNGPIAYLPLDSSHSSLIWSTTTQEADRLMKLGEDEFINELNNEMFTEAQHNKFLEKMEKAADNFVSCLPKSFIDDCDHNKNRQLPPKVTGMLAKSRATFPLGFMHSVNYVARNTALIGDSAHRILPLAGQGVNLGFGDAEALARCISEGVSVGEAIGDFRRLQQYETERQRYVLPVAATIQTMHHLYISKFYPIVLARSFGLKVANAMRPLKKLFMDGATRGQLDFYGCFLK